MGCKHQQHALSSSLRLLPLAVPMWHGTATTDNTSQSHRKSDCSYERHTRLTIHKRVLLPPPCCTAVMPYSCPKGEPLQDCTGQPLCSQKQCGRGYRCIESYCGTCQATCVENLSPAQCNSTKFMPVCGKDGKTYGDVCHARRIGVGLACRGPCKSTENSKCSCQLFDPDRIMITVPICLPSW